MHKRILLTALMLGGCSANNELDSVRLAAAVPVMPPQKGTLSYEITCECPRAGLELILEVDGTEYHCVALQPNAEELQKETLVAKGLSPGEHRFEVFVRGESQERRSLATGSALVE